MCGGRTPKNQNQKAFDYSRLCKHNLLSESPEEKETEFNQFQSAASSNRYAYLTAWCYENGYGVKQDTGSAKMWYQTIPGRKATEALERLSKSSSTNNEVKIPCEENRGRSRGYQPRFSFTRNEQILQVQSRGRSRTRGF